MSDLNSQQLGTPQTSAMPTPATIASAATIAPTTLVSFITGTVQVANITPFVTGAHMLVLIFTNGAPGATLTTGNIQRAFTPIQNNPVILFYDPLTAKYWVMGYAS